MKKKISQLGVLGALLVVLTGCGINVNTSGTSSSVSTGGLYRSDNKGNSWLVKSSIMGTTRVSSFSDSNVWTIAQDPTDSKAIYVGTVEDGLFYTLDSGESWLKAKTLGSVFVRSVVVDPLYRCTIYVATGNKVVRSLDCARSWQQVYYDNDQNVKINSIVIDPKDGSKVFIATSRGEVIKSKDRANSWQTIYRVDGKITKLYINPQNGQTIFAANSQFGLSLTTNGGTSWSSLDAGLKAFSDGTANDLAFSDEGSTRVFLASHYGLMKSDNNGHTWSKIDLITPKEKATINALAVNPQNDNEIYYVTYTTFYRTSDGGKTWTVKELPTSRAGSALMVDPANPLTLFMGFREIKN